MEHQSPKCRVCKPPQMNASERSSGSSGLVNFGSAVRYLVWTCLWVACVTFIIGSGHYWYGGKIRLAEVLGVKSPGHRAECAFERGTCEEVLLNTSTVLECFQVHQPVLTPWGWNTKSDLEDGDREGSSPAAPPPESCSVLLMEYSFGFSYGHPFVGYYKPPSCSFNRVTMNFTVTSRGRQFDRLALMYLNDTEVFRTSTAEPTMDGIIWTYTKDVSSYLSLWVSPQKIIFDLGNLVDDTYTGLFNTTLTATFFTSDDLDPAHLILPISTSRSASNTSSHFVLPESRAVTSLTLPRNVCRALVSLSVAGQATEEFWWANVPSAYTSTFEETVGVLYGFSPFRQILLYIDSQPAGLSAPFPVVFTGGVVPALWRPIAGPDTFDLRDAYIDITPFLGVLSDGSPHTFEIKIEGFDENGPVHYVGGSWFVSGKVLLWLDDVDAITTGSAPIIIAPPPVSAQQQQLTQDRSGANISLSYTTTVRQSLSISSIIHSQKGVRKVSWIQRTGFIHSSQFSLHGARQVVDFKSDGVDVFAESSSEDDAPIGSFTVANSYGLVADTNITFYLSEPQSNLTIEATLGMRIGTHTKNHIPGTPHKRSERKGSFTSTGLDGMGYYFSDPKTRTGLSFGRTKQDFFSGGPQEKHGEKNVSYEREVEAVNGTVTKDREVLDGKSLKDIVGVATVVEVTDIIWQNSARKALGRGPK